MLKRNPRPAPVNDWTREQMKACFPMDRKATVVFRWKKYEWCVFYAWQSFVSKNFYISLTLGVYDIDRFLDDKDPVQVYKLSISDPEITDKGVKCSFYVGPKQMKFTIPFNQISTIVEKRIQR